MQEDYCYKTYEPGIKEQIVDMAINVQVNLMSLFKIYFDNFRIITYCAK